MAYPCCTHQPILIKESLAFVCHHKVPRAIVWPEGFYLLRDGNPLPFESLRCLGRVKTDAYGDLDNYDYR